MFWKKILKKKETNSPSKSMKKIFVCQYCGGLTRHILQPCIFCGKIPQSLEESVAGCLMSSDSMDFSSLKATAQAIIQYQEIPEVVKQKTKESMADPIQMKSYEGFTAMIEKVRKVSHPQKSIETCVVHNTPLDIAIDGCFSCLKSEDEVSIMMAKSIVDNLSQDERTFIALSGISKFFIRYVDHAENTESFEAFLINATYDMNEIHRNGSIKKLSSIPYLQKLGQVSSPQKGFAVTFLHMDKPDLQMSPDISQDDVLEVMKLCKNYNYLCSITE